MADEKEGSGMEVEAGEIPAAEGNVGAGFELPVERMGLQEEEEEEEVEAGEILETGESNGHAGGGMEGMQGAAPEIHGSGEDSSVLQINGQARVVEEEPAAAAIPQDVLLAAEAADALNKLPVPGKDDEESEDSDEDDDDHEEEGMVEEDSDPLVESDESSDSSSDEEEEDDEDDEAARAKKAVVQKNHAEGVKELEKMVQIEKGGSSDDEDGVTEPPRTANEVTVFMLNLLRHAHNLKRSQKSRSGESSAFSVEILAAVYEEALVYTEL